MGVLTRLLAVFTVLDLPVHVTGLGPVIGRNDLPFVPFVADDGPGVVIDVTTPPNPGHRTPGHTAPAEWTRKLRSLKLS